MHSSNGYYFVLEPSVTSTGEIYSWEMLTKFESSFLYKNNISNIESLDVNLKNKIFVEQLDFLNLLPIEFKKKIISLNVNDSIASFIIHNPQICEILYRNRVFLRLEINEWFSELAYEKKKAKLSFLSNLLPLWLDDFGAGLTNFTVFNKINFEVVKIDKDFYWKHRTGFIFPKIIEHLREVDVNVIVEGIENTSQTKEIFSLDIIAGQGHIWKDLNYES